MAFVFERILTGGNAELSDLVGDDSDGVAAFLDPTPDVDKYVELAHAKKDSITHVSKAEPSQPTTTTTAEAISSTSGCRIEVVIR